MKVLVTGSREFTDRQMVFDKLNAQTNVGSGKSSLVVIHGAASGADQLASAWCSTRRSVYEIAVPAKWDVHAKLAGPLRNTVMLSLNPDVVLAFYQEGAANRGTSHMVMLAKKAGIPVNEYWSTS